MAKGYRATLVNRLGNKIVSVLLRLGVTPGRMALLTVPGRKTGLPRSTPVAVGERDGRRWLIAAFGEVNWVRNLRAAGGGTIRRGRRTEAIAVVELPPKEAAPILKEALTSGPSFIRPYFDATPESPLSDFEREAARHPVFLIQAAGTQI